MKREEIYKKEREELLIELLKEIGVDNGEKRKLKDELEKDSIKEYVRSNNDRIKRYYSTSRWRSTYRNDNKEMNIIKNIMREHDIEILKLEKKKKLQDGIYESHRLYIFEIPEEIKQKIN